MRCRGRTLRHGRGARELALPGPASFAGHPLRDHPLVLPDRPGPFEAVPLAHRDGRVVEERRGGLAVLDAFRIALDRSTAEDADLLQGAAQGARRNTFAAVPPV